MDCDIVSTRIFPVRREQLFRAWSDPVLLKEWWGPTGFTNTFHEFDFRVGGRWRFTMHGPDKGNYENECEFTRIMVPELISWKRYSKPLFQIIAGFEEVYENSSRIIFTMRFDTPEECQKLKPYVVEKNEENFDRLEVLLAKFKFEG